VNLRNRALAAYQEEIRPRVEAAQARERQREEQLRKIRERQARIDELLLSSSDLRKWFPGERFVVHDHTPTMDGTVFEWVQDGPHLPIRFLLMRLSSDTVAIYWVRKKERDHTGQHACWPTTTRLYSAADVGREIATDEHEYYSSMPDHMP
jgi:hypothetical protein